MKSKLMIIYCFIISSFFFTMSVKADYKAVVINPSTARCELFENSTGGCFYKDKNLDSVGGILYLDTGDELNIITSYEKIKTKDVNLCPSNYVYASYLYPPSQKTYYGYYCEDFISTNSLTDELKESFKQLGFPESYWESLAVLKKAHPNWEFRAVNTYLNFNDAVIGENVVGRSLVEMSASNNYAYFDIDTNSFNYYENHFNDRDRIGGDNPWCDANKETIAYYMDPRNFLNDMYIFQFEGLSYDDTIDDETYKNIVSNVFSGDYLYIFIDDFIKAGKESKVSPVYLASLSKQEVGVGEKPNSAISGEYNGMYNFYNIGATGDENPVINGLNFAALNDPSTLRPWDTEYKAIVGGALWMADMYIGVGQDTSFFKKWNVVYNYLIKNNKVDNPYGNYTHQYMTNIMAPSSEAYITYKSYFKAGLIDSGYIFYIPVYNNMPSKTSLPTQGGWPNNYLKNLVINGNNVTDFDGGVLEYTYYLDINNPVINISAESVSNKAKISGIGEFKLESDTVKDIIVTAENGNVRTYKLNIKLTGEKLEESIDVQTTLNNSGIKNGSKYLSGFNPGFDISKVKEKIINANKDAIVTLTGNDSKEKNGGKIFTGDKVGITVANESKEYEIVLYGDANGDGEINAIDYVKIRKYIMNTAQISGAFKEASDVNHDGEVNAIDYVKIRKFIMNTGNIEQ